MRTKLSAPLFTVTLILAALSLTSNAYSQTNERCNCFSLERSGLLVEIDATSLAWPGENITIFLKIIATQANIHIRFIHIEIFSLGNNRSETPLDNSSFLTDYHLGMNTTKTISYKILVPTDTLPGLLYGKVEYRWSIEGDVNLLEELNYFPATYIQNKPYEDLRQNYEALNSLFNDLMDDYARLEGNLTDLQQKFIQLQNEQIEESNATNLMYLFLVTTGVFIVTTILLMTKRPRASSW